MIAMFHMTIQYSEAVSNNLCQISMYSKVKEILWCVNSAEGANLKYEQTVAQ